MAKATLPQRLIRDIARTLQDRINEVKNKIAEHYEQCLAELRQIAETFGVEEDELFALAGVPKPEEKTRRPRKKATKTKKVVNKKVVARKKAKNKAGKKVTSRKISTAKKRSGGTTEENVAAMLKKNPVASAADISKATGYADKSVYGTKAWKNRPRSQ